MCFFYLYTKLSPLNTLLFLFTTLATIKIKSSCRFCSILSVLIDYSIRTQMYRLHRTLASLVLLPALKTSRSWTGWCATKLFKWLLPVSTHFTYRCRDSTDQTLGLFPAMLVKNYHDDDDKLAALLSLSKIKFHQNIKVRLWGLLSKL